jgi:Ca2+-binding EF-hand superfamily protein
MEYMGIDEDTEFPTQEEIVAAVEKELARDGGITKEEAAGAIAEWADSQGVTIPQEAWDILEAGFDEVDADGDGELTAEEIGAAFPPQKPKKGGKKGPKGGALLKMKNKLKNKLRLKNKSKQEEEGVNEFEAWAGEQLANGGTITKQEGYEKLTELGVPESMMDEIEAGFDAMDTNGDGALDQGEVETAMEYMGIDEDTEFPTQEEIVAAVEKELARDGGITKEEAAGAIAAWADSQGVTIPQEAWDVMEAAFDAVDANGDGALTADELEAAFA